VRAAGAFKWGSAWPTHALSAWSVATSRSGALSVLPHEARNVTRYCSDLGALASKSPAKRSVGHPAPRVHRASCLGSTPARQSRPPLALRTRAPRRRPLELDDIRTVGL